MNKWIESEFTNHLYFREETGLIIGLTHKLGNQKVISLAKVYVDNNELNLGQYISIDFAKKAVEEFWLKQERTLLE